ncbi:cobalt ECF transporter T component CbiQ [Curvibacter gracilis]|uniref:cobalt ECF transporter T component CbiQ n=1 Tax=Curvibacter gracilis TaxID=230310 RepID=UPI000484B231|nr:cobalt ECF transporter T component CbiQ [Curvibacter gracilis]
MLIEHWAYANRWRGVSPAAKGLWALAGLAAAQGAATPGRALGCAAALAAVCLLGAGVPWRAYLRAAWAPLGFLALSAASMAVSLGWGGHALPTLPTLQWPPEALALAAHTSARALASLAALLGLVLTTPLPDLMALLRRLRVPDLLLELMVLCHRLLFVALALFHEASRAQRARLGYASRAQAVRSIALLLGHQAVQLWQRARVLQASAEARCGGAGLRFLPPVYPHARRDVGLAALASLGLLVGTWGVAWT